MIETQVSSPLVSTLKMQLIFSNEFMTFNMNAKFGTKILEDNEN
jgi:hypothetical protein